MRLAVLHESGDLLDRLADFGIPVNLYSRDGYLARTPEEIQTVLDRTTEYFSVSPLPGITPIRAKAVSVDPTKKWRGRRGGETPDNVGKLRTTVEEFIRMQVEFGIDPYIILRRVKDATDQQTVAAAHNFLKDEFSGLRVAMIGDTVHNIPAKPDL